MALTPCPECGRQVSSQAEACPGCGHPIRPAEYRVVEVQQNLRGRWVGKAELEELLREGWKVVEQSERTDEFTYKDDDGELAEGEVYVTIYKLRR